MPNTKNDNNVAVQMLKGKSNTDSTAVTSLAGPGISNNTNNDSVKGFTSKLFKNIVSADHKRFVGFTPFVTGRGFFLITKMPYFLEQLCESETKIFKQLTQFYVKGISGFVDATLVTTPIETGIENAAVEIVTSISGSTKELVFEYGPEIQGQFITKYLRLWCYGLIDPNTHDAHYHGAKEADGKRIKYAQENHIMEGIYFVTDPQRTAIEGWALVLNMIPKIAPLTGLFDHSWGEHNFFNPSIPYTCQVFENNVTVGQYLLAIDPLKSFFKADSTYDTVFFKSADKTSYPLDGSHNSTTFV